MWLMFAAPLILFLLAAHAANASLPYGPTYTQGTNFAVGSAPTATQITFQPPGGGGTSYGLNPTLYSSTVYGDDFELLPLFDPVLNLFYFSLAFNTAGSYPSSTTFYSLLGGAYNMIVESATNNQIVTSDYFTRYGTTNLFQSQGLGFITSVSQSNMSFYFAGTPPGNNGVDMILSYFPISFRYYVVLTSSAYPTIGTNGVMYPSYTTNITTIQPGFLPGSFVSSCANTYLSLQFPGLYVVKFTHIGMNASETLYVKQSVVDGCFNSPTAQTTVFTQQEQNLANITRTLTRIQAFPAFTNLGLQAQTVNSAPTTNYQNYGAEIAYINGYAFMVVLTNAQPSYSSEAIQLLQFTETPQYNDGILFIDNVIITPQTSGVFWFQFTLYCSNAPCSIESNFFGQTKIQTYNDYITLDFYTSNTLFQCVGATTVPTAPPYAPKPCFYPTSPYSQSGYSFFKINSFPPYASMTSTVAGGIGQFGTAAGTTALTFYLNNYYYPNSSVQPFLYTSPYQPYVLLSNISNVFTQNGDLHLFQQDGYYLVACYGAIVGGGLSFLSINAASTSVLTSLTQSSVLSVTQGYTDSIFGAPPWAGHLHVGDKVRCHAPLGSTLTGSGGGVLITNIQNSFKTATFTFSVAPNAASDDLLIWNGATQTGTMAVSLQTNGSFLVLESGFTTIQVTFDPASTTTAYVLSLGNSSSLNFIQTLGIFPVVNPTAHMQTVSWYGYLPSGSSVQIFALGYVGGTGTASSFSVRFTKISGLATRLFIQGYAANTGYANEAIQLGWPTGVNIYSDSSVEYSDGVFFVNTTTIYALSAHVSCASVVTGNCVMYFNRDTGLAVPSQNGVMTLATMEIPPGQNGTLTWMGLLYDQSLVNVACYANCTFGSTNQQGFQLVQMQATESTYGPTFAPSSSKPTKSPSRTPTKSPSRTPTKSPSRSPSRTPSTSIPTRSPTTPHPTPDPSHSPTRTPTRSPSKAPSRTPSTSPTALCRYAVL